VTAAEDSAGETSDDDDEQARPTAPDERIVSLDVLRGIAIFGILVINIQSFSMPTIARINPTQYGEFGGVNLLVWLVSHVFFEQKFIALFSLMFGAGIVLFMQSKQRVEDSALLIHYRRTVVLLLIGLGHAYLLWDGDILVIYALCGFWSVLFWEESPRQLLVIGAVLIAIPSLLSIDAAFQIGLSATHDAWTASEATIQAEIDAYQGSWLDGFAVRREDALAAHTTQFLSSTVWRYTGLMLWGMALYKLGLLANDWSRKAYRQVILAGGAIGFLFVGAGVWLVFSYDWAGGAGVLHWELNNIGALFLAPAYASLVMYYCKDRLSGPLITACRAVGRTALSNYLFQTVVATTIFYGYGLGLYGRVTRVEQMAVVLAIWLLQAVLSVVWLRRFEYGPVEWLWRRGTYGDWR
jgi:uncharacterized protein